MRLKFDEQLKQLGEEMTHMGSMIEQAIQDAVQALLNHDVKTAQRIMKEDDLVDQEQKKIENLCFQLLIQQQPVARDLRTITAAMKMVTDMERIGDHAMNIAECAKEIHEKSIVFSEGAERELKTMFAAVQEITYNAITAFTTNDLELAYRIEPLEELIDSLCDEMKLHHVDRLQRGICKLSQGFVFNDLLTNYERVADHCSNIAVAMIELESDSFDTHEYLNSVKAMKSASFARYSAEYQKKYTL